MQVDRFHKMLEKFEPSDWLFFIDPRHMNLTSFDFSKFSQDHTDFYTAKHLVAVEAMPGGTKEYVLTDSDGQVSKIQRFYEGKTWVSNTQVLATLVSAASILRVGKWPVDSLSELRGELAGAGIPSQDVLVSGNGTDLFEENNLMELTEQFVFSDC